jgi:endonuclease-3
MNQQERIELFSRFKRANPNPQTELTYHSEFELLIAVILSAQATDKRVNIVTAQLFPVACTPEQILALGLLGLKSYIKSIGLYNSKAENIIKTCRILVDQHAGSVPSDRASLEALPGVGRKTANVLLNTLFGEATIAVDTHIFRVANRTGLAPGKHVLEVERKLEENIPAAFKKDAHHWLVLHGRYVCKARKPECWHCLIQDICEYPNKSQKP